MDAVCVPANDDGQHGESAGDAASLRASAQAWLDDQGLKGLTTGDATVPANDGVYGLGCGREFMPDGVTPTGMAAKYFNRVVLYGDADGDQLSNTREDSTPSTLNNGFSGCADGIDDDLDGLTDCADADCSSFASCVQSTPCGTGSVTCGSSEACVLGYCVPKSQGAVGFFCRDDHEYVLGIGIATGAAGFVEFPRTTFDGPNTVFYQGLLYLTWWTPRLPDGRDYWNDPTVTDAQRLAAWQGFGCHCIQEDGSSSPGMVNRPTSAAIICFP
jgi:hypothetical protein